jgi:hypothetical protein
MVAMKLPIDPITSINSTNGYKEVNIEKSEAKLKDLQNEIMNERTKQAISNFEKILATLKF